MTATMVPTGAAVDAVRAGVDGLLSAELTSLSSTELTGLVADLESQRRRLEAVDQRLLAEVADRGLAGDYGATSCPDLLVQLLRVSRREAKARMRRAGEVGPRRGLTGEALAPIFPAVAAAVAEGVLSAEHADVILKAVDAIPQHLQAEFDTVVEDALVEAARALEPRQVAGIGNVLLDRLDPDGAEPREQDRQRRRGFGLREHRDGTATPYGMLTPEATAVWRVILDALSAPRPESDTGERDDRSAGQRRHDALLEAGQRLLSCGNLPDTGGVPTSVIIHLDTDQPGTDQAGTDQPGTDQAGTDQAGTDQPEPEPDDHAVDLDDEAEAEGDTGSGSGTTAAVPTSGPVFTSSGIPLTIETALRMADQALITTVLLNSSGGILSYGQTRRLASCAQRQALAARDKGCSFPGCTRPPSWCQAHHVTPWLHGGPTDLDNLVLVCSYHHREFERRGWQVIMTRGTPEWIPPAWLDPLQRPRRNQAHHLAKIDFTDSG